MAYAFKIGDRVIVTAEALTRVGQSGVITLLCGDDAVVQHDDGEELAYLLDDGELRIQESMPSIVAIATKARHTQTSN